MREALYIGILTPGTTSRMRAEWLREVTPGWAWDWIDTDGPLQVCRRWWRSLAFRTKAGPAVTAVNRALLEQIGRRMRYDLVWIDKGVFLLPSTLGRVRGMCEKLIHFTPDTAFHANCSRHFEDSLPLYDLVVTTKSFEWAEYRKRVCETTLHATTQGFDPRLHRPLPGDVLRERAAAFVGLAEPDRERCILRLLEAGVPIRLGGRGWEKFVRKHGRHPLLRFLGPAVFGKDYASVYSSCRVGLGLLSKRFPELHTTRTFEIPACGAMLATEATADTVRFFNRDEALFFKDHDDLAQMLAALFAAASDGDLDSLARRGRNRVLADGRNYHRILLEILNHPRIALGEHTMSKCHTP